MKTLKVILIGAGTRGRRYTNIMADNKEFEGKFEVVAVAEPCAEFRNFIKEKHNIPDEMCFESWEPLLDLPKIADAAIIATMDQEHYYPTLKAIEKGYDLLMEKPLSNNVKECVEMANAAKKKGVKVLVCHVLRHSPIYSAIRKMIIDGKLGEVLSIHHSECVSIIGQSNSFVRGNWGNSDKSSPMILQKSCHDMDIMQWMIGKECKKVQSFGSLTYFTKENAPEGSPERCDKTCPSYDTCPFNAIKVYVEGTNNMRREKVANKKDPTNEEVMEGLKTSQYGKCVFKCDNNVVDHQVVNLEFEGSAVASFNMCGFNKGGRFMRVMGTKGEVYANGETGILEYYDFLTHKTTVIDINKEAGRNIAGGHSGGDEGIVSNMYDYFAKGIESKEYSEIGISAKNHIIAFAAEKSRVEGKIVDIEEYEKELGLM